MVTKKRLKEVLSYVQEFGEEQAVKSFDISHGTIKRYDRLAREVGLEIGEFESPKILLLDLETSPWQVLTWGVHKQYVPVEGVMKRSALLTYAAKWVCDTEIMSNRVSIEEASKRSDESIINELWDLFDKADVVVAHNMRYFDNKVAKTRFLMNGLTRPSPYQIIDTLKEARKEFRFASNKLEYLAKTLGIRLKDDTDFSLWKRCITGDDDAIEEMLSYNEQDVRALEDLYFKIRGWITSHPNVALYYSDIENRCPNCGSKDLEYRGRYNTMVNEFDAYKCNNCGAYARDRHTNLKEKDKQELIRPIAR